MNQQINLHTKVKGILQGQAYVYVAPIFNNNELASVNKMEACE
jgi:hypothetical protein